MAQEKPFTEQEKRYLGALKLFMEQSGDPKHLESVKWLDELAPEPARAIIAAYRLALEDPRAFVVAYKIALWRSNILHPWTAIVSFFRRRGL